MTLGMNEGVPDGVDEGKVDGIALGANEGVPEGLDEGNVDGIALGWEDGLDEGKGGTKPSIDTSSMYSFSVFDGKVVAKRNRISLEGATISDGIVNVAVNQTSFEVQT